MNGSTIRITSLVALIASLAGFNLEPDVVDKVSQGLILVGSGVVYVVGEILAEKQKKKIVLEVKDAKIAANAAHLGAETAKNAAFRAEQIAAEVVRKDGL